MSKILFFGPRHNKSDHSKTGGIIVLFELLLKEMKQLDINHDAIDINAQNYKNFINAWLSAMKEFTLKFKKFEYISIHGTVNHYLFVAPITIFIAKLFNKKISLRKFAGNFDLVYKQSNFLKKIIIKYVLKNSDINFFETKHLVNFFKKFNPDTYWFPNVRERKHKANYSKKYEKKFVFMSHVKKTKGIDEIIKAFKELDSSYSVDIYGFISNNEYTENDFKGENISYKGALKPEEVISTLKKYDVLLLPTFHEGEGYPGIIIEAYSLGIPCITTDWNSINEIVDDGKTGFLIQPKKYKELIEAIKKFNQDNYNEFMKNADRKFDIFDSKIQTKKFLKLILKDNEV